VANGVVYFASYDNLKMYALNASTGAQLWSYSIGGTTSSPAVVYIGSYGQFGGGKSRLARRKTVNSQSHNLKRHLGA
jgi:outer membrane protein assembly factor BamB